MTSATLVLSWLVLAHLAADFVFQTETIAVGKFGDGMPAWRALFTHVTVVGILTAPLVLVYGLPGLAYVGVTVITHLIIDRSKIMATRRVERAEAAAARPAVAPSDDGQAIVTDRIPSESTALAEAVAPEQADTADQGEPIPPGPPLDRSWSPVPAGLFALDQVAHLAVLLAAWAIFLSGAVPLQGWVDGVGNLLGATDPLTFHRAVLVIVVLTSLAIVNVRAGSLFVGTLVRAPLREPGGPAPRAGTASPARIGATIGILERLLICALVLGGALASLGLVIGAKTLARFKQLDDREFAEYYLLGTLASVTIAVVSSVIAQQALV